MSKFNVPGLTQTFFCLIGLSSSSETIFGAFIAH